MKVGNQKQPFISFICYEGSRYSAKSTWHLQWISVLGEFIGRYWKTPQVNLFHTSGQAPHLLLELVKDLRLFWNKRQEFLYPKKRSPLPSLTQPMLWIGITGVGISPLSVPLLCPLLWVAEGYPRQCVASVHSEHEISTCGPHKDIRYK